jgi:hypothetical protein
MKPDELRPARIAEPGNLRTGRESDQDDRAVSMTIA